MRSNARSAEREDPRTGFAIGDRRIPMVPGSEGNLNFCGRHRIIGLSRALRSTPGASRSRDFFERLAARNGDPLEVFVDRLDVGWVMVDGPHVDQAVPPAVRRTGLDGLVLRGERR